MIYTVKLNDQTTKGRLLLELMKEMKVPATKAARISGDDWITGNKGMATDEELEVRSQEIDGGDTISHTKLKSHIRKVAKAG